MVNRLLVLFWQNGDENAIDNLPGPWHDGMAMPCCHSVITTFGGHNGGMGILLENSAMRE